MKFKKDLQGRTKVLPIVLVVAFLALPCLFCFIFHGSGQSSLFGLPISKMSVEFWGSFWISFISLGVTSLLTYRAYVLSIRLGDEQELRQIETDKMKFKIMKVQVIGSNRGLRISLPIEVVSTENLTIENAQISFSEAHEIIQLAVPSVDKKLSGSSFDFLYIINETNDPASRRALQIWFEYPYDQSLKYRVATLTVNFKYSFLSYKKKSKYIKICSVAKIAVDLNLKLIEEIIIEDRGVFTPPEQDDLKQNNPKQITSEPNDLKQIECE